MKEVEPTSATEMAPPFPRYWKGYIAGTNRGEVVARLRRSGDIITGRATVLDRLFAAVAVSVRGTLKEQHAELEIREFRGFRAGSAMGVTLPVAGKLTLAVDLVVSTAQGQWTTDIGTNGFCRLEGARPTRFRFWSRIAAAHVCRWTRLGYLLFLIVLSSLDSAAAIKLSVAGLVFALIPGAYLFRFELTEIVRMLGIKRAWGVEFQQPVPSEVLTAIGQYVQQQVQEAVFFITLDQFFAIRTKAVLAWLAGKTSADRPQFNAFASQIGVPAENIEATWTALIGTGCSKLEQEQLTITERGRRYVAQLQSLSNVPASTPG